MWPSDRRPGCLAQIIVSCAGILTAGLTLLFIVAVVKPDMNSIAKFAVLPTIVAAVIAAMLGTLRLLPDRMLRSDSPPESAASPAPEVERQPTLDDWIATLQELPVQPEFPQQAEWRIQQVNSPSEMAQIILNRIPKNIHQVKNRQQGTFLDASSTLLGKREHYHIYRSNENEWKLVTYTDSHL